jgi:hypothetical protein
VEFSKACICKILFGYYNKTKIQDKFILYFAVPPSAPRNLTIMYFDQTKVILRWLPPHCWECDGAVKYVPANSGFNQTSVTIEGLDPSTSYTFAIYARNGISAESGSEMDHFVMIKMKTDAAGEISRKLVQTQTSADDVTCIFVHHYISAVLFLLEMKHNKYIVYKLQLHVDICITSMHYRCSHGRCSALMVF